MTELTLRQHAVLSAVQIAGVPAMHTNPTEEEKGLRKWSEKLGKIADAILIELEKENKNAK